GRLDFGMLRDARSTIRYRATRISPWRASAHSNSTRRQQAPRHHLRPQGGLRPTLGLRTRGLGAALLRQTGEPALNGSSLVPRALRRHYRHLLQTGKQSLSWLRRRPQQQNTRLPATRLRAARRRISPPQGSYPVCCRRYAPQNNPLDSLNTQFINLY